MKERNSGFRNESSNTKRTGLFQIITVPLILIYKKVSSYQHINEGIEDIMAEYVHQEMT